MGYIEQNLMPGENVTYRAKLHWFIFFWPIIITIIGLLLLSSGDTAVFGVILFLVGIIALISSAVRYATSEFGITDRRVMMKSGFIRRNSLELLLDKIEGVSVDQSILGRIVGYGNIIVTGTGGLRTPFKTITEPMEFRQRVYAHLTKEE
jgi:uncharacterized membrane protein YdbT with pleckstrin-like domain